MKITKISTREVVVDVPQLEWSDYTMEDHNLSDILSGQSMTMGQVKETFTPDEIVYIGEKEGFLFLISRDREERSVYLKADTALKLVFQELWDSLPDDTEVRFD
jgi:hypothetical protein